MSAGASAHIPVLLNEAVEGLKVKADGTYVDCTFGRGGHSKAILGRLGDHGRLIALDKDPDAIAAAKDINDARLTTVHAGFAGLDSILKRLEIEQVNGILLDLGVSSPQLDNPARGFSFRNDGPLDMRMDSSAGQTVAEWLNSASEAEITTVIKEYGEERFAKRIAHAIVLNRIETEITTTQSLAQLVEKAVPTREPGQHPATRTFQALRIFINRELDEIAQVIPQSIEVLAPGGRLVVISFHSLEDRIVKRAMRAGSADLFPAKLPIRASEMSKPKLHIVGKPIKPSAAEIASNPRARSAVMRIAERLAA